LLSTFALIGLPPFSLFVSEILIIFATIQHNSGLVLPLITGLLLAFSAMIFHVQRMVFYASEENPVSLKIKTSTLPIYLHLILLATIGISVPLVHLMSYFP
jgi:hydrogenase-4 component F